MRGDDGQQLDVFSYVNPEQRVPQNHPLRPIRAMADEALRELQPRFKKLYAKTGRSSIAPEKLLRALLLQVLYSLRSERMLMEQLDYNLLFRWFVGLNMDDTIWDATVFTKNRQRVLGGDIADAFFEAVLKQARSRDLLSDEHFTVDGTLLEAWAGQKSRASAASMTTSNRPPLRRANDGADLAAATQTIREIGADDLLDAEFADAFPGSVATAPYIGIVGRYTTYIKPQVPISCALRRCLPHQVGGIPLSPSKLTCRRQRSR
jgi:transposase